jgi:nitrate/nitrite transporter NarK
MVSAIGNLSGFLPPYIVGWIRAETGSFSLGMLFLAGLAAIGGIHALAYFGRLRREGANAPVIARRA